MNRIVECISCEQEVERKELAHDDDGIYVCQKCAKKLRTIKSPERQCPNAGATMCSANGHASPLGACEDPNPTRTQLILRQNHERMEPIERMTRALSRRSALWPACRAAGLPREERPPEQRPGVRAVAFQPDRRGRQDRLKPLRLLEDLKGRWIGEEHHAA